VFNRPHDRLAAPRSVRIRAISTSTIPHTMKGSPESDVISREGLSGGANRTPEPGRSDRRDPESVQIGCELSKRGRQLEPAAALDLRSSHVVVGPSGCVIEDAT
jgi:hypothetical protein